MHIKSRSTERLFYVQKKPDFIIQCLNFNKEACFLT
jgi:hypothetical protein